MPPHLPTSFLLCAGAVIVAVRFPFSTRPPSRPPDRRPGVGALCLAVRWLAVRGCRLFQETETRPVSRQPALRRYPRTPGRPQCGLPQCKCPPPACETSSLPGCDWQDWVRNIESAALQAVAKSCMIKAWQWPFWRARQPRGEVARRRPLTGCCTDRAGDFMALPRADSSDRTVQPWCANGLALGWTVRGRRDWRTGKRWQS